MSRTEPELQFPNPSVPSSIVRSIEGLQRFSTSQDSAAVSANYTILPEDDIIEGDTAAITITLPMTVDAQRKPYWVVNSSAGNINVALGGSDTAVNWTSALVVAANGVAMFMHNNPGTNASGGWYRLV